MSMDFDNPDDPSVSAKSDRNRCSIDFVYCNICLTAICVRDCKDEDILYSDCKAEVEHFMVTLLGKKGYSRLNYFLLNIIWMFMFL